MTSGRTCTVCHKKDMAAAEDTGEAPPRCNTCRNNIRNTYREINGLPPVSVEEEDRMAAAEEE